jgi:hypothetical protein
VSSLDQHSLASATSSSSTAVPVRQAEELNFDLASCSSATPHHVGVDEEEGEGVETLVRGDEADSVVLSPRASQEYSSSRGGTPVVSPRSGQILSHAHTSAADAHPSPSPTVSPRSHEATSSAAPPPRLEDVVEQAMSKQPEPEREREEHKEEKLNAWNEPVYVQISHMKSKKLKTVKWNGNNDPYVVVSIGNWSDETDVVWSANENFAWPLMNIVGVCDSQENSNVLFTVYNANLIRDDQIIGVGSVSLDEISRDIVQEVDVDIYEQGGKQRFRGTVVVTLVTKTDFLATTSHCNNHHAGKKEKLAQAGSILASSSSQDAPLAPSQSGELKDTGQANRAQPKFSRTNSSDKMHKAERKDAKAERPINSSVKSSRDASQSQRPAPSLHLPQGRAERGQHRGEDGRRTSLPETSAIPPVSSTQQQQQQRAEGAHPHYARSKSSSNMYDAEQAAKVELKKSKSAAKKKKNSSKKQKKDLSNSEFIGNKVSVSPDIKRIIDKAYQQAIHEESSAIRLSTYETALVLDALNIELSASPKEFLETSPTVADDVPDDVSFRSSRSGASCSRDSVLLSLQSPSLLAAALSEFVRDKGIVKRNMKTSRPFTLSEQQAIVASNHLISLVRGNWKNCRKIMLMAATNKGLSSEDNRPEYWGPHWMSKILTTLQMPPLHLSEDSGADMIQLTKKEIHSYVKPSILRTRCRLYVTLMTYLNDWWSEGSRPQDPLSSENPECEEEEIPVVKKKKTSRDILDGEYVKIAKSESLLKAMMPVHRAYAWSANVEEMTCFCDIVGGMIGMTMKHPPYGSKNVEAHGMKWITFREDATLAHSNISILSSLREFGDSVEFIAGRCVYVPQICLKKHTAPVPNEPTKASSKTKNLPISNLINCDVKLGMKVKVLDIDALYRAYERFDWWERPSIASLSSMAGRPGVIVSLPTPSGTEYKRYGVSVVTKLGHEIVDALPPDAMEDASVVAVPRTQAVTSAAAPSNKVVNNNISKNKVKMVNVNIPTPDHMKPTDTSIRNSADFFNSIPSKANPFVHLDLNETDLRLVEEAEEEEEEENAREEDFYDMEFPTGGDESLPPPHAMTFEEIEDQIRRDDRVEEVQEMAAEVISKANRPLYRPVTPSHIDKNAYKAGKVNKFTSSVPRGEVTEAYSDTNNYGWMRKVEEKDNDFNDHTAVPENDTTHRTEKQQRQQRPKSANAVRNRSKPSSSQVASGGRNVKMQTAELDLKDMTRSPDDKSIPRFQTNINKSRARAEKEAIRKRRADYEQDVEDNAVFFDGSEEGIDFGISGLGFTGAKASVLPPAAAAHDSPKRYPKRPSSANKALRGGFRPKSASNPTYASPPRKKLPQNNQNGKDAFFVQSSKHHIPSPADDVAYSSDADKAYLKRELRRTEKESKAKEQSLVSQLKSLGITVQDLDISY